MPTLESLYTNLLDREINNNSSLAGSPFSSTNRQQAVNDAQEEFADLTECFVKQSTIACSCNTAEYSLLSSGVLTGSTDFVRLAKQGVEYHHTSSGGRLRTVADGQFPRRDIHWLNQFEPNWRESTTPVELPTAYYLRGDGASLVLGLKDRPDIGSSETGKLLVPYVARPAPMTSSTDVPFAGRLDLQGYHKALPHYAAYKLLPLMGDMQGANEQLQKFMGYVQRYLQDQRPKGGTHVTTARSYFGEARRTGGTADRSIDPRFGVRSY